MSPAGTAGTAPGSGDAGAVSSSWVTGSPARVICDGAGWTLGVICEPANGEPEFAMALGAATPTVYAWQKIPRYVLELVRRNVVK